MLKVFTLSPYGITVRSIKENEDRVKFLGYNIFYFKWLTFVLSSTLAAFPGTLFAVFYGFVAPTIISPFGNMEVIFAVLIGGAGNLYGAIIGGVVYKLMSNYLATNITRWEMFLGILLLVWVFKFRRGLTGYASELDLRSQAETGGGGVRPVLETLIYGLTIGAILYFFSIGLSITFGTMQIVNFAHGMVYSVGVYLFITFLPVVRTNSFPWPWSWPLRRCCPLPFVVERLVIRRLYGESLDYAIIATYAVLADRSGPDQMDLGRPAAAGQRSAEDFPPLSGHEHSPVPGDRVCERDRPFSSGCRAFFNRSIVGQDRDRRPGGPGAAFAAWAWM